MAVIGARRLPKASGVPKIDKSRFRMPKNDRLTARENFVIPRAANYVPSPEREKDTGPITF